ncbi:FecR family protein [Chitinophaga rupis]|uniref:FecR family protein n=1 Tax=Chitinophaga rupis TaxID=573321 RepID=A0A1H8B794_9BACT|nr:FecR domain-containing protein [Chitinophaga rupis]SEM78596.1 FecR family protein [Chitinophaga rupis]
MSETKGHYEELLQRYLEGSCTPEEAAALYNWLKASDAHRPLLARLQQEFEQAINTPHEIPAAVSDRIEARLLQHISRNKIMPLRHPWRWAAVASVLMLLLAGSVYWFYKTDKSHNIASNMALNKKSVISNDVAPGTNKAVLTLADGTTVELDNAGNQVLQQGKTTVQQRNGRLEYAAQGKGEAIGYNTLVVPRGGQFNIVLPDGSHVWLNAASRLKYPTAFTGKERVVELQGQGYFEITHNADHPFIVAINNTQVQVLGTRFDIMAYPDEQSLNTTLLEGAVRVQRGERQQLLKPGQQSVLEYTTGQMSVRQADIDQTIAWKTGFFEFDNAGMNVIMRQLARWYDVEVTYGNVNSNRLFGGRISRNLPLSEILHMLEANGAKFSLEGRRLTVTAE